MNPSFPPTSPRPSSEAGLTTAPSRSGAELLGNPAPDDGHSAAMRSIFGRSLLSEQLFQFAASLARAQVEYLARRFPECATPECRNEATPGLDICDDCADRP